MTDQWWSPARQDPAAIPFRNKFDQARDPLTARNALGAVDAKYVADAITAAGGGGGGGNVSNSGTPTLGQYAKWTTATTIQGVAPATVLSDIGAQPAGSYQPLDADLTAIAALTGTDTIYYRSGVNTWSAVTYSGLTFSGGVLTATASGAPASAEYITSSANATLSAERVLTNTTSITWDFATAGQAKANHAAHTGDVTTSAGGVATTIAADAVDNTKLANMAQATVKGRATGAGTGDPTDLTATQVGAIIAPAWTAYTPTVTAVSGTLGTTVAFGTYQVIGKTTFIQIRINITTNGSAAGGIKATLPTTPANPGMFIVAGREDNVTGNMLQGTIDATTMNIFAYNNTYPGGSGTSLRMSGCYEST